MRHAAFLLAFMLLSCSAGRKKPSANDDFKPSALPSPVVESIALPRRTYTEILAHNVIFYESSGLKLRVRWLRGRMYPAKEGVIPSFDHPESFTCEIDDGALSVNLANFSNVLNNYVFKNSPLHKVKLSGTEQLVQVSGILQKGIPLPVRMTGILDASHDGRIHIHVSKLAVLKIPLKGLLNGLHVKTEDLFDPKGVAGIEVQKDEIYIDPSKVLPPPHNFGRLTKVRIVNGTDLLEIYGVPRPDVIRVKQWRNFMSLRGGTIDFGKLTMHNADMVIVDISQDEWFHFDLARYQEQLVNGYARITPNAGLQMFMPDIGNIPNTKANHDISLQWLKDREVAPPADVPKQ